jgi:hypothetical protein
VIELGYDGNQRNLKGETALHLAVKEDTILVKKLIENGCNFYKNSYGLNPFELSISLDKFNMVKMLSKAKIFDKLCASTNLYRLANSPEMYKYLKELKICKIQVNDLSTLLVHYTRMKKWRMAEYVLLNEFEKSDYEKKDLFECIFIHYCFENESLIVLEAFVNLTGADARPFLEMPNRFANTLLHIVSKLGSIEICKFLLDNNVSQQCVNFESKRPIDLCEKLEAKSIIIKKMLEKQIVVVCVNITSGGPFLDVYSKRDGKERSVLRTVEEFKFLRSQIVCISPVAFIPEIQDLNNQNPDYLYSVAQMLGI